MSRRASNGFAGCALFASFAIWVACSFSSAVAAPDSATAPAANADHWSLRAPHLVSPPQCKNRRWIRNPIDAFILARLESQHLAPSPEADRATLIRRLCLDLLGLPPTPAEVAGFVNDRSPDAYESLVDRLLASPHFGERWGRHWLDLARYADSDGYQIDRFRPNAFRYRDWVVNSLNRDQAFDAFTIEQIAGDLLPNATPSQKIATGFHRNTLVNNEDGVDQAEFQVKAKVDRVATTGTVWLGLTVGCCECHSHKYDPISQREFYQLYAFFDQAGETTFSLSNNVQASGFCELTNPPATHVHLRGDFLRPGPAVEPGTLAVLHPFHPRGSHADRLDLARWLVDPANPLTARVAVNQAWLHLFGRGLVATPEDFGTRGDPPSHPALLDWLAITFSRPDAGGLAWSRKQIIKLIVTSATYRQSSRIRPDLLARDPENTFVARQNRFRVDAEIVRDLHLAVSGLLNPVIGGPPIHPPMPPDLLQIGYHYLSIPWEESKGADRYRRGIYIQAHRTVPYPMPALFDAADPNAVCTRRTHSTTPLQALTLLNNQAFIECARALGHRMQFCAGRRPSRPQQQTNFRRSSDETIARLNNIPPSGDSPSDITPRLSLGFTLCLGRPPTRAESDRLEKLFAAELQSAGSGPAAESAAWTAVAQVLLNLDEFLTRE